MDLSNLTKPEGATKNRKRKGRGVGSGNGKTAGRGHKGQLSRSGGSIRPGFEGGQMPLHMRIPKRGFTNIFATQWDIINLRDLEQRFETGDVVDIDSLVAKDLIWSRNQQRGDATIRITRPVKVLAKGSLTKAFTVKAHKFSKAAAEAIAAAGGSVETLER